MPLIPLTAKEIHILIQAIRIAAETGELTEFAKAGELSQLRNKLQNIKDVQASTQFRNGELND